MLVILPLLASCVTPPTAGPRPEWVARGTGMHDRKYLQGVGAVEGIHDAKRATVAARNRARAEIRQIVNAHMTILCFDYLDATSAEGRNEKAAAGECTAPWRPDAGEGPGPHPKRDSFNAQLDAAMACDAVWIDPASRSTWALCRLSRAAVDESLLREQAANTAVVRFLRATSVQAWDEQARESAHSPSQGNARPLNE